MEPGNTCTLLIHWSGPHGHGQERGREERGDCTRQNTDASSLWGARFWGWAEVDAAEPMILRADLARQAMEAKSLLACHVIV